MFDHRHYVPVLKARQGEFGALATLSEAARKRLTPIIELQKIPFDHKNKVYKRTLDQHIAATLKALRKSWLSTRRLLLDVAELGEAATDPADVISRVYKTSRALNVISVPVVSLIEAGCDHAIREAISADDLGVCLRLGIADLGTPETLASRLQTRLGALAVTAAQVDLVLDLRGITNAQLPVMTLVARSNLERLPLQGSWRSLTLLSTAFPDTLGGVVKAGTEAMTPRSDWMLWSDIVTNGATLRRLPTYGDYAIQHPYLPEIAPQILNETMIATIRYTCSESWLIIRGRRFKTHRYEQFHELAAKLRARKEYCGADFSWGDRYIDQCAVRKVPSGNQGTWRQVGTSHHLELVVKQISTLFDV